MQEKQQRVKENNMRIKQMKKEYNFSKGERGKFYHKSAEFNIPIYLEPDIADFMHKLAGKKNVEVEKIVNDWLRRNIGLLESIQ